MVEIGKRYEITSMDAYDEIVEFASFIVEEIYLEEQNEDGTIRVHEINHTQGCGSYTNIEEEDLEWLIDNYTR